MEIHDQIRKILLSHVGKSNAIKSPEIADIIGIDRGPSNITIRNFILETMEMFHLPFGASTQKGYFLIENEEELKEYKKSLQSRSDKIYTRKILAELFFKEYYGTGASISTDISDADSEELDS